MPKGDQQGMDWFSGVASLLATLMATVSFLARWADRHAYRRRKERATQTVEDWQGWAASHNGKVWLRDYLEGLFKGDE